MEFINEGRAENDRMIQAIGKYYSNEDAEFGKWIVKYLKTQPSKLDFVKVYYDLIRSIKDKSVTGLENWFHITQVPMLNYFVNKTFGKTSLGSRLRQMLPLTTKASTGNKALDNLLSAAFIKILNNAKVLKSLLNNKSVQKEIAKVATDIYDDIKEDLIDYHEKNKNSEEDSTNENIFFGKKSILWEGRQVVMEKTGLWDLMKGIGKAGWGLTKLGAKGLYRGGKYLANKSKEGKYSKGIDAPKNEVQGKFKILDNIMKMMPSLNQNIQRSIWDKLSQTPYEDIEEMVDTINAQKMASLVSESIVTNVVDTAIKLYFKKPIFMNTARLVRSLFKDNEDVKVLVNDAVAQYFKYAILKLKEQKQEQEKYYNKSYGRNKYKM